MSNKRKKNIPFVGWYVYNPFNLGTSLNIAQRIFIEFGLEMCLKNVVEYGTL